MQLSDFMFKDDFTGITDVEFQLALNIVEVNYAGVKSLWGVLEEDVRKQKQLLCMNWLLAWQLLTLYPSKGSKTMGGTGSMPLSEKALYDVRLKYASLEREPGQLTALTNNAYGVQALLMIQNAPEAFMLTR